YRREWWTTCAPAGVEDVRRLLLARRPGRLRERHPSDSKRASGRWLSSYHRKSAARRRAARLPWCVTSLRAMATWQTIFARQSFGFLADSQVVQRFRVLAFWRTLRYRPSNPLEIRRFFSAESSRSPD